MSPPATVRPPGDPQTIDVRALVRAVVISWQELLGALDAEPDAPRRTAAAAAVEQAFERLWGSVSNVELHVSAEGVKWDGAAVLLPEEDVQGLGTTLASAGIERIAMVPGVERGDLLRFLDLVHSTRHLDAGGDRDLTLSLFRADLRHLRFGAVAEIALAPVDRPASEASRGRSSPGRSTRALREALREDVAAEGSETVRMEDFDSTLYFLDASEVEYLRSAIDLEYTKDHALGVVAMLLDVLQLQQDDDVRWEVIGLLQTLLPYLLGTGRFDAVAYLTSELRAIARKSGFDAAQKRAVDELRVGVSRTDTLGQLFHLLNDGTVEPSAEQLGRLLREMRSGAIRAVLVWIGQLERPATKAALIRAVEDFFREWPAAIGRMTDAPDRTVVQRALAIAADIADPAMIEPVGQALRHPDPSTRRRAIATLSVFGTAEAFRLITAAVPDEAAEVRLAACRALSQRRYRSAGPLLLNEIRAHDLEARELGERRALFRAYAVASGLDAVPLLAGVLRGRGGLARRPSSETRSSAAAALGLLSGPEVRAALERATRDRDVLVRNVAASSLRGEAPA